MPQCVTELEPHETDVQLQHQLPNEKLQATS